VFVKDAWNSMEAPQNHSTRLVETVHSNCADKHVQLLCQHGICKSKREKVEECAHAGSDA
jgi:hypothetical protein